MSEKARAVRALLRKDYGAFARRVFSTVSRGEALSRDPYIEFMFQTALNIYTRRNKRTVFNVAPRHAKTLGFVVPLILWWLAHSPATQIMILSFREGLAEQIVNYVREVLTADWFEEAFPNARIKVGHNRSDDFGTTAGGRVFAHHLGPGITGEGADLIVVDDANDITDAAKPRALETNNNVFDDVVLNRLNHPREGCIVIVGHRVAANDLSGHAVAEPGWTHVYLPFIAERDETYVGLNGKLWHRRRASFSNPPSFPKRM